eukprot:TRINITY_DN19127_c0_g1_i1.p1 TRINITY_DN19127_c0_g1~~TRINITY_DN19127_c0_g1_i1.p1  ORF type:complete len:106 (-),score=20.51 TRINITY_DN19127_c0_g1_i1:34-351(-)
MCIRDRNYSMANLKNLEPKAPVRELPYKVPINKLEKVNKHKASPFNNGLNKRNKPLTVLNKAKESRRNDYSLKSTQKTIMLSSSMLNTTSTVSYTHLTLPTICSV